MEPKDILVSLECLFEQCDLVFTTMYSGKNIPIPEISAMLSRMNSWTEKQLRSIDPVIRYYFNSNSKYIVIMGAGGGVNLVQVKKQIEQEKIDKKQRRIDMKNKINQLLE